MESLIFEMIQDLISWAPFTPSLGTITLTSVGDLKKVTLRMPGLFDYSSIRLGVNVPD